MKRTLIIFTAALLLLVACNNTKQDEYPQTDTGVATAFLRNVLDNKLDAAAKMVLKDEENNQYFDIIRQQYAKKGRAELEKYHGADILINEISNVTDSITIVNYSNSISPTAKNKVKVVRINNQWLIDLKYTFSGNL